MGRAASKLFAEAGARILVADRNLAAAEETAEGVEAAGGQAHAVEADVSDEESVERMVARTVELFGALHCAFNNAGVPAKPQPAEAYSLRSWEKLISINLTGTWLCMKYELLQFARQGEGGAIVNNASAWGLVGWPGAAPYVASKHGVVGLTKAAALDHAGSKIRINAVCPGLIRTPMSQDALEASANMLAEQPMGRCGEPEEVAQAALWLCSDAASFVTGTALLVDGGWSV